ncbi:MAG: SAM-dependent methyltransferase [Rhodospirillaceae bacterium]|nr:SAM-dependent methyltransferase [Rhodospirillaceae bacterium]
MQALGVILPKSEPSANPPDNCLANASAWVRRFLPNMLDEDRSRKPIMLDLAAGSGRHVQLGVARGWCVVAADRDTSAVAALDLPEVESLEIDLESGSPADVAARLNRADGYDALVVTNYLYRPLLPLLPALLAPDGVMIYETFMIGNERFGQPRNPNFLLQPGELLEAFKNKSTFIAFEQGYEAHPSERMIQRVVATPRSPTPSDDLIK